MLSEIHDLVATSQKCQGKTDLPSRDVSKAFLNITTGHSRIIEDDFVNSYRVAFLGTVMVL